MTEWLGILEPEKQYGRGFLRFSFCLRHPRLATGKVSLEMASKHRPKKAPMKENTRRYSGCYTKSVLVQQYDHWMLH